MHLSHGSRGSWDCGCSGVSSQRANRLWGLWTAQSRALLGALSVIAGAVRFAIEFIRINERVVFGLTVAHLGSLGMMAAGILFLRTNRASVQKDQTIGS
jgi:prolipoprotein diacylglyceryltransferase